MPHYTGEDDRALAIGSYNPTCRCQRPVHPVDPKCSAVSSCPRQHWLHRASGSAGSRRKWGVLALGQCPAYWRQGPRMCFDVENRDTVVAAI